MSYQLTDVIAWFIAGVVIGITFSVRVQEKTQEDDLLSNVYGELFYNEDEQNNENILNVEKSIITEIVNKRSRSL